MFTINLLTYSLRLHPLAIFVAISVCVCVADAAEYKSVPSTAVNCEVDVSYRYQQTAAVNNVPPATYVIPATVLRPEVIPCSAVIQCESKKVAPPKTFCNIFTQVRYISVKFCQYVTSLYLHMVTDFGGFVLIFNKIALIFLGVPIVINVSSFKFHQVKSR